MTNWRSISIGVIVLAIILAASLSYSLVIPPKTVTTTVNGGTSVTTVTSVSTGSAGVTTVTQTSTMTSSGTSSLTALNPDALAALAQAEGGTLNLDSIMDPTTWNTYFLPNFTAQYPWAKVSYTAGTPSSLVTGPITALQSGHVTDDVIYGGNMARTQEEVQGGVCASYNLTNYLTNLGYPSGSYDPNGQWYISHETPYVVFYNTNLVKPSQVPKNYSFLADPAWNGKIALSVSGGTSTVLVGLRNYMDNATWLSFVTAVGANNPGIESSGGTAYTLVAQGQYQIGIDTLNDIINGQAKGQPVAVDWQMPYMFTAPSAACIATDAPHPAMALLFMEWFLSMPGSLVEINAGQGVAALPAANVYAPTIGIAQPIPSNQTQVVAGTTSATISYYSNPAEWTSLLASLGIGSG